MLRNVTAVPLTAQTTYGTFYVQQASHIFTRVEALFAAGERYYVEFRYFADSTLGTPTGVVAFTVPNGGFFGDFVPVLGPYLQVRCSSSAYPSANFYLFLMVDSRPEVASMRTRGKEIGPTAPIAVAGAATVNQILAPSLGGPGFLYWEWSGAAYTLNIFTTDANGATRRLVFYTNTTAPAIRQLNIGWPPGMITAQVISGDGAAQSMHLVAMLY